MTLPLPMWLAAVALLPRWQRDAAERLGWRVPPVQPGAIWVHASSVGEVGAALGLIAHLPPPVLLTASTDTGAAVARAQAPSGVAAGVLPVDHPWALAPLWAEARPRALVFVEGEWWPALAARARSAGVPIVHVSARVRRSGPSGAIRWGRGSARILARTARDAAWFAANTAAPVEVTGDLKASRPLPQPRLRWPAAFVVGASTRHGDEAALLAAHPRHLLLAPRDPRRFAEVAGLLDRSGRRWIRRSDLTGSVPADPTVVLLDTLGELAGELAGASAAFIGGTFDPTVGGHSPVEAWRHGVPVVRGPFGDAHADAFDRCGATVAAGPDRLAEALARAVPPPAPPDDPGALTAAAVLAVAGPPAPEAPPRPWARPLVPVVRIGAYLRRRPRPTGLPTVAVGSDNARGAGKTGLGRWVAALLAARGHTVGVVVRGYRRTPAGRDVRLSSCAAWRDLGDEGALYARDGHLVASGPDRHEASRTLRDRGVTVVVLDDGLQQGAVAADLRIAVVDARFPRARGPLPAGERRPDAPVDGTVVLNGALDGAWPGRRVAGPWRRGGEHADPPPGPVAVFAGLPRPADLLDVVDADVDRFRSLANHAPIPDALARELWTWADGRPLVCSARDHVRLPGWLAERVWWRDQHLAIDAPADFPWP